jgi:hypothetical protein
MLVFPIHPIIATPKASQTVSDSNHPLLKSLFGLAVCQSCGFSLLLIVLLLLNCCLRIFDSLSCPTIFFLNLFLKPFCFQFMIREVCFVSFPSRNFCLELQPAQYPKASHAFCFTAALAIGGLMMSAGGQCVGMPYMPARCVEMFFLITLTIVVFVDFVIGRNVG